MSERQDTLTQTDPLRRASPGLVALGGVLGAVAASSCCLLPLALFGLGIGGAWIGNLAALAPYQPIFIVATLACLGVGYWMVCRRPRTVCDGEVSCGQPSSRRLVLIALWGSTVLVAVAAAFPYVGPQLLGV